MNGSGEAEEIREGDLRERERCALDPLPIVAGAQAVLLLLPLL
jgi:hypothetical protein